MVCYRLPVAELVQMRSLRELVVGDNQLREVSALLGRLPLSEVSFLSLQYNPLRDGAALEQALQQGITCTTLTYTRTLRYDHIRTKFAAREGSRFSSRLPKVPQNIFSQIRSHIYPTSKHVACTRARTCTYTRTHAHTHTRTNTRSRTRQHTYTHTANFT